MLKPALSAFFLLLPVAGIPLRAEPEVYNAQVQSTELLKTAKNAASEDIVYPVTTHPEVSGLKVKIPPGCETGWHSHTVPGYAYMISGALTLRYKSGVSKAFKAGEAFVEAAQLLHNGRNEGSEDVVLIVFFTAEAGKPFTLKAAPEPAAK